MRPGAEGSGPTGLRNVNGTLFLFADDGQHGTELWRSDGTESGTFQVGEIAEGALPTRPSYLSPPTSTAPGQFLLHADDGVHGRELWTLIDVNAAPGFVRGSDVTATDYSGPQEISAWANPIIAGPPDEVAQRFTFHVTVDQPELFLEQPAIDAQGNLSFTPNPGVIGTARVTVVLQDDGGTANGGVDTSPPQTFAISITEHHWLHNYAIPRDVDKNNYISAGDALTIINFLNAFGASTEPEGESRAAMYYDVDDDGFVSAGDALDVINHLNTFGPSEGEPATSLDPIEAPASAIDEVFATASSADTLSALLATDAPSRTKRRR